MSDLSRLDVAREGCLLMASKLLGGLLFVFVAVVPLQVKAQDSVQRSFRPLTQAMLNDPDPAD